MSARKIEPRPEKGSGTVDALRRLLERKAAQVIRNDPEEANRALELGLIDRRWLEDPGNQPVSQSKPTEILEHFLARSVERKPSLLSTIGLSAVQLLSAHGSSGSGETQLLTVAFTDLEGFTSFTDANGDEAAVALIDSHHRKAGSIVRRRRGRVVKHLGDGLLCTFADPGEAIRASLELSADPPAPLRLRAGLHLGEAVVSHDDVVGHVVNVAAHVAETADGGQVVVTKETADAAGPIPGTHLRRLRRHQLKGISQPMEMYEVVPE